MISKEQELRILGRLRNACARREYAVSDVRGKALAAVEKAMQTHPQTTAAEGQPGNASAAVGKAMQMHPQTTEGGEQPGNASAAVGKAMQMHPQTTEGGEQPGNASAAVERIVESLISDGFVSDVRYAAAYAREKSSIAGWGAAKIRYMLASKGISAEDIASALSEIDRSAADARLRKTLAVKYAVLRDDPRCRLKLLRFLTGRGYSYDEAARAISQLLNE